MSIRIMQEQSNEEASWIERLRPQIEHELRQRIADEIHHSSGRGLETLRILRELATANDASKKVRATLDAAISHVEHWLHGIRDGSVGRKP